MIKLKKQCSAFKKAADMKDGEIAVITVWSGPNYVGRIVQRYGNNLVSLGMGCSHSWSEAWGIDKNIFIDGCLVRTLAPGDELVIE